LRQRLSEVDRDIMIPMYWRRAAYTRAAGATALTVAAGRTALITTAITLTETSHVKVFGKAVVVTAVNDWGRLELSVARDAVILDYGYGMANNNAGNIIAENAVAQGEDNSLGAGAYNFYLYGEAELATLAIYHMVLAIDITRA